LAARGAGVTGGGVTIERATWRQAAAMRRAAPMQRLSHPRRDVRARPSAARPRSRFNPRRTDASPPGARQTPALAVVGSRRVACHLYGAAGRPRRRVVLGQTALLWRRHRMADAGR
jgi:hypothetical protein